MTPETVEKMIEQRHKVSDTQIESLTNLINLRFTNLEEKLSKTLELETRIGNVEMDIKELMMDKKLAKECRATVRKLEDNQLKSTTSWEVLFKIGGVAATVTSFIIGVLYAIYSYVI